MLLFLTFFLVTGKGQRVKPVSLLLHVRDIAIRLVGNLILQASSPSSWPQSSQPSHTSDPSSTSFWGKSRGVHETLQADMGNEFQTPFSHRNYYYPVTSQWEVESGYFSSFQLCFVKQPWLLLVAEGLDSYQYVSHTLKIPCENMFLRRPKMTFFFFFPLQSDVTGTLQDRKRP